MALPSLRRALLGAATLALVLPAAASAAGTNLALSQVYGGGGNTGATYKRDFIEVYNRGTAPVDLAGFSVAYFSAAGGSGGATSLSGTIAPGGYALVGEGAGTTGGTTDLPGPDVSGSLNLSGTNGRVDLLKGATLYDRVAYGTATPAETAAAPALTNATAALRLGAGCTDTDSNAADFTTGAPAPRTSASPTAPCGTGTPPADTPPGPTPISAIQGSAITSPAVGQTRTVRGVVTGIDDQDGASFTATFPDEAGIYVQSLPGDEDADAATSEGLFVGNVVGPAGSTAGRTALPLGSVVTVTGTVRESFNKTVLVTAPGTRVAPEGTAPLPAPVTLDPALATTQALFAGTGTSSKGSAYYERFEDMRVRLAAGVANAGGTNKFNEVALDPCPAPGACVRQRRFRNDPDVGQILTSAEAGTGDPADPNEPGPSTTEVHADLFDEVDDAVGPLSFDFGQYQIVLQAGLAPTVAGGGVPFPPSVPAQDKDTLTFTAFNVENFFPPGERNDLSVISQAQYEAKRDAIAYDIDTFLGRPDIVGLEEVALFPGNPVNQAQDLARVLGGYTAYIEPGNDTRRITVAFLVKDGVKVDDERQLFADDLVPAGVSRCSDSSADGEFLFNRPPLAIDVHKRGLKFTAINNHWASQSHPEACRDAQADALRQEAARLEAQGRQVLVAGDLNDFEDSDALTNHLVGAGTTLANLWERAPADNRYSFVFNSRLQTLDHVFVTAGLADLVQDVRYVHFDNDYWARPGTGVKVSDHDPPLVTLALKPAK